MERPSDRRLSAAWHLTWLIPAGVLVWHALRYAFVTDDAYISFVYARNLAEHGELVFNLGRDPVEGYSNFLWTVALAALMKLGIGPEIGSQLMGMGFGAGTLYLCARITRHLGGSKPSPWDAVAPILLATSAGFACWSSGGLETQMFTFWVTLSLRWYLLADDRSRAMRWTGLFIALAALTRPEGMLVGALIGIHRVFVLGIRDRRWPGRDDWQGAMIAVGLVAMHLAFRWIYYGYPLPNTYYIKAAGETSEAYDRALWAGGWYYLQQWATQSGALAASPLVLAGLLAARLRSRRLLFGSLAVPIIVAYVVYVASVGGDFMGLHRFVMPLFVLVALGVGLGLRAAGRLVPGRASLAIAGLAVLVVSAHGYRQLRLTEESTRWGNWAADHGIDTPAYLQAYTRDRARIGEHMRECFEPDDFSIVGGAGAQPYFGRMQAIDVFGLVSEKVAHEVAPRRPRAGHNKWAPDPLLAELEPDFVFSCYSIHADPRRPRLNCNPSFWRRRGFELVTLHIPELRQQGEYYTFLVRKDRDFQCPGRVDR